MFFKLLFPKAKKIVNLDLNLDLSSVEHLATLISGATPGVFPLDLVFFIWSSFLVFFYGCLVFFYDWAYGRNFVVKCGGTAWFKFNTYDYDSHRVDSEVTFYIYSLNFPALFLEVFWEQL